MKVTQEMVDAALRHLAPTPFEPTILAALEAVFKVIDPVPENVRAIIDDDEDTWYRNPEDPNVWIHEDGLMFRTYQGIEAFYGPVTWEGK